MSFSLINYSVDMIVNRPISSIDGTSHRGLSLKGRGICLIHTLATPLKAWSALGKLVLLISQTAAFVLAVLTLNAHPKHLINVSAKVIDIAGGTVLLPIAFVIHLIRGITGTIIHPGMMIKDDSLRKDQYEFYRFGAEHNILQGTLVHYRMA